MMWTVAGNPATPQTLTAIETIDEVLEPRIAKLAWSILHCWWSEREVEVLVDPKALRSQPQPNDVTTALSSNNRDIRAVL